MVYIPIYFLWGYYAVKVKTLFFFNTANPLMKNGGFIMDSKKEIYDSIPQNYYPKTALIAENTPFAEVLVLIKEHKITFPCIVKPDIGLRGSAVKKVTHSEQLAVYHEKANFDYLLQDFIPYPNEVGIFYVRFPNETQGKITGIVAKEFLIVEGDGKATITDLLQADPRYALQLKALQKEYGNQLNEVIPKGEKRNLVPYGNHARGAKFIDVSHLISEKLTQTIDAICLQIPEFYFGRMDVMYQSWDDLENGKNFSIVELNGAASEPTHIYDPKHSLFFAWKELARHITYMFKISVMNHQKGLPFLSHQEGMKLYRRHVEQTQKIVSF